MGFVHKLCHLGLSISSNRSLNASDNLGNAAIEQFEKYEVECQRELWHNLLTVRTIDSTDNYAMSSFRWTYASFRQKVPQKDASEQRNITTEFLNSEKLKKLEYPYTDGGQYLLQFKALKCTECFLRTFPCCLYRKFGSLCLFVNIIIYVRGVATGRGPGGRDSSTSISEPNKFQQFVLKHNGYWFLCVFRYHTDRKFNDFCYVCYNCCTIYGGFSFFSNYIEIGHFTLDLLKWSKLCKVRSYANWRILLSFLFVNKI